MKDRSPIVAGEATSLVGGFNVTAKGANRPAPIEINPYASSRVKFAAVGIAGNNPGPRGSPPVSWSSRSAASAAKSNRCAASR